MQVISSFVTNNNTWLLLLLTDYIVVLQSTMLYWITAYHGVLDYSLPCMVDWISADATVVMVMEGSRSHASASGHGQEHCVPRRVKSDGQTCKVLNWIELSRLHRAHLGRSPRMSSRLAGLPMAWPRVYTDSTLGKFCFSTLLNFTSHHDALSGENILSTCKGKYRFN